MNSFSGTAKNFKAVAPFIICLIVIGMGLNYLGRRARGLGIAGVDLVESGLIIQARLSS